MRGYWCYLISLSMLFSPLAIGREKVLIFAASSMASALNQIAEKFQQSTGEEVTLSYGASSALARQLAHGAPADIYISANQKWMQYAVEQHTIDESTLSPWLNNTLVVIASHTDAKIINFTAADMVSRLGNSRLAIANPQYVPAGIYAKEALETGGLWEALKGKLALSNSARATLALVEREEAPLGIVYFTDAIASSKVAIVARIPEGIHDRIVFPKAMTKRAKKGSERFFAYLDSAQAQRILLDNGFMLLSPIKE